MRLLFTSKPALFSLLVRWLTGETYSHVAVQFPDGIIYESVISGVRKVSQQEFFTQNHIRQVVYIRTPQEHAEKRAASLLGTHYDVPALLWFLVVLLAAKFGKKLPYISINPRWYLCSEYAYFVVTGTQRTVTPREVYNEATWG